MFICFLWTCRFCCWCEILQWTCLALTLSQLWVCSFTMCWIATFYAGFIVSSKGKLLHEDETLYCFFIKRKWTGLPCSILNSVFNTLICDWKGKTRIEYISASCLLWSCLGVNHITCPIRRLSCLSSLPGLQVPNLNISFTVTLYWFVHSLLNASKSAWNSLGPGLLSPYMHFTALLT